MRRFNDSEYFKLNFKSAKCMKSFTHCGRSAFLPKEDFLSNNCQLSSISCDLVMCSIQGLKKLLEKHALANKTTPWEICGNARKANDHTNILGSEPFSFSSAITGENPNRRLHSCQGDYPNLRGGRKKEIKRRIWKFLDGVLAQNRKT